jgi:predicted DNA-binding protein (MmcQ/YjbR family)
MDRVARAAAHLRKVALGYPEAWEDHPWGDDVIKVRTRIFLFLGEHERLSVTTKLPVSSGIALAEPNARPTGYGLGRAGWVSISFEADQEPPLDMLELWIDESYREVAPKRLVAQLDARNRQG